MPWYSSWLQPSRLREIFLECKPLWKKCSWLLTFFACCKWVCKAVFFPVFHHDKWKLCWSQRILTDRDSMNQVQASREYDPRPSHFTAIVMLYSLQVLRVFELSIYRINKATHLPQTNQSRTSDLKSLDSRHIRSVNRFWGFVMEQKTRSDFKGCAGYLPQRSTATEARISERASTRWAAATCHTQHTHH